MLEHGMGPGYRSGAVLTEAAELDGGESALGNAIIRAVVRGVLEKSATAHLSRRGDRVGKTKQRRYMKLLTG